MDIIENTATNFEKQIIEEMTDFCIKEDSDLPVEKDFEYVGIKDNKNPSITQEDDFSKDCCGEKEWLLDEKPPDNLDTTGDYLKIKEDKQRNQIKSNEGVDELKNITFEDKEVPKEDMIICQQCHRVFINEYKLVSHLFNVHRVKKRGKSTKSERSSQEKESQQESWTPDVQKLAKRVKGEKIFICNQCSYTVTRCDSMSKHMLRVHGKGLVKPQYMCEVCGKTFIDMAYLRNHGLSHIQDPQFFCEICGRSFYRQPSLKRHIQGHSEEKQFACSLCDYETNRKHLMYKHAENHRTGKVFTCKHCLERFYTQLSLRKHKYSHHTTRYACSFCKIGFSSKERMWSHMQKIHFAFEVKDFKTEYFEKQAEVKVEYIEVKLEPKV